MATLEQRIEFYYSAYKAGKITAREFDAFIEALAKEAVSK
jgi:hypothetical protein